MSERVSRALDYWVGLPLCWVLTLWRRLVERKTLGTSVPRRIMVVKLSEMGALILAIPAFEAAASRVGRKNLFICVMPENRPVLDLIDVVPPENILVIRDQNIFTLVSDTLRMMWRCRREGIDTTIDLEGFARVSAIVSFLSGARQRVGWHRYTMEGPARGDLFTHRVPYNVYQHVTQQFLTLVEAVDAPSDEYPLPKRRVETKESSLPMFRATAEEVAEVEAILVRRCGGRPSGPRVILNPNLIDTLPVRRWPREHYLELGRRILASHPTAVVLLTGLAAEREQSEQLAREISPDRAFSLAGDTSLRGLLALFGISDLLVTSDCGPAHMAAITPIPIVSLFGPETHRLYGPLSPRNVSLEAGLACGPCLSAFNMQNSPCKDNVCMRNVTVEQVYGAAREQCAALASESL